MSLASLKKHSPSVKRRSVSMDEFIDDALKYQQGVQNIVAFKPVDKATDNHKPQTRFKRATFTLGDEAINALDEFARKSGVCKSRLIRIWLNMLDEHELVRYQKSKVK